MIENNAGTSVFEWLGIFFFFEENQGGNGGETGNVQKQSLYWQPFHTLCS